MYDSKPIITGIIIFLVIFTYPLWSNIGSASTPPKPDTKPALEYAKKANLLQTCVLGKDYMRTSHMVLLDNYLVMHGRCPFEGTRKHAVTWFKSPDYTKSEA